MASTQVAPEVTEAAASLGPGRHEARERAIALLYEGELRELDVAMVLAGLPVAPAPYAVTALEGVEARKAEIDALIEDHAEDWSVERLPAVDRAILRLAVWELVDDLGVPDAVVIDEAIELAKEYSTERSSGFVNGVLDAVARTLRS